MKLIEVSDTEIGLSAYQHNDQILKSWCEIWMMGFLMLIGNFILYSFLRSGLDVHVDLLFFIFAFYLLLATLPVALVLIFQVKKSCFLTEILVGGIFSCLLIPLFINQISLLYSLALLSTAISASQYWKLLRGFESRWLWVISICVFVSIYFCLMNLNMNYATPFAKEQAYVGLLNHDTKFLSSIANMIQNYGTVSIGTNGLSSLSYHFGSIYWMALVGALAGKNGLETYSVVVPVLMPVMLLVSVAWSSHVIRSDKRFGWKSMVMSVAFLLLIDSFGFLSHYQSESYTAGLIAFLFAVPTLFRPTWRRQKNEALSGCLLASLLLPILFILKVSVGVLWMGMLIWSIHRSRGRILLKIALLCLTIALAFFTADFVIPSQKDYPGVAGAVPFYIFSVYPDFRVLSCFVFLAALLVKEKRWLSLATRKPQKIIFNQIPLSNLELLLICAVMGSVPAFVGIPKDSAVWYFINVIQWPSLVILLASINSDAVWKYFWTASRNRYFVSTFIVMLFSFAGFNNLVPKFQENMSKLYKSAIKFGDNSVLPASFSSFALNNFIDGKGVWNQDFSAALENTPGGRLVEIINNYKIIKSNERIIVSIPPENIEFWDLSSLCWNKHNSLQSIAGAVGFRMSPPEKYKCSRGVYLSDMKHNQPVDFSNDVEVCRNVKILGFDAILTIESFRARDGVEFKNCR